MQISDVHCHHDPSVYGGGASEFIVSLRAGGILDPPAFVDEDAIPADSLGLE